MTQNNTYFLLYGAPYKSNISSWQPPRYCSEFIFLQMKTGCQLVPKMFSVTFLSGFCPQTSIRGEIDDCSVRLIKPAKLYLFTQKTINTTRTDARRRKCAAMVPYRWATRGTSLRKLEHTHTHTLIRSGWMRLWILSAEVRGERR